MLTVGTMTYADVMAASDEGVSSRYSVVATLVEDAPRGAIRESDYGAPRVPARWRSPGGVPQMGRVAVDPGLDAGERVRIWVDWEGRPEKPPATPAEAVAAGRWPRAPAGSSPRACWG